MKIRNFILLLFILSITIRLFLNFSSDLIPGVNGGYYPLQVRAVLDDGNLAFSDMPLLFYLDALIVKIISYFGVEITNNLIVFIVKLVDSVSFPLLLIPIGLILRRQNTSIYVAVSILAFSVLSFSPLILISDLQKNSLAIVFFMFFLNAFIKYRIDKGKYDLAISILFILLTAFTHFGTFVFGLLYVAIDILFYYRKRAILPLILLIIVSLIIVYFADGARFTRLLSAVVVIFEKPALLNGAIAPPDFLNIGFSIFLSILSIRAMKSESLKTNLLGKSILLSSSICLIFCSFPLLDIEYFRRLSLFLFIPQVLSFIYIITSISKKQKKYLASAFIGISFLSVLFTLGMQKQSSITTDAYLDIKNMKSIISDDSKVILIARHGLEWWLAWELKSDVGQEKALDADAYAKYDRIIIVNQVSGFTQSRQPMPFHEPEIPAGSLCVYSSDYFTAYEIVN